MPADAPTARSRSLAKPPSPGIRGNRAPRVALECLIREDPALPVRLLPGRDQFLATGNRQLTGFVAKSAQFL